MKRKSKKPTTYETIEIIVKIVTAIAAILSAVKWW